MDVPAGGTPAPRRRVAVLISGRGSNMAALLEAAAAPGFPAEVALVLSNRADAAGLAHAAARGVATAVVESRPHGRDRAAHERAVQSVLEAHGIELVCLAGYMRILTPWLVGRWAGRMLNIHPSLLPAFPGLDTHQRAIAAGCTLHGCTVHLVTEEMDAGPILAQAAVPVLPGDDPDTLAARVLAQEHRLYPLALRRVAAGAGWAADPGAAPGAAPESDLWADPGAALLNPAPR
ncbi:phosphoribosylglycinamide formyltransferase [Roseomonas sp. NAR14]|uniref:Phosphoribosylglycinamide formyltransferase n=1 Tax=Roseomonas acroporae TaxID=2937791 RepID=A0A9X2BSC5_9PROT|nr:phosphoribosylglycinamide formyltransferase [Roseomonas acroporae]MCK8782982.1 phosphoribosylglycinamide formyltransferase [Roseomonas acroporae]